MEGLESVYPQAMYGMTRENKIMEHQELDLILEGNELISQELCFMSDLGVINEIQQQQHVGQLDCLLSNSNNTSTEDDEGISTLFSDCQTLWSFGGVSSSESENKETTTTTINPKSLKRNRQETDNHFRLIHHPQDDAKEDFKLIYDENQSKSKKPRIEKGPSNISFQHSTDNDETDAEAIAQMKEMIYRAAAFRPVNLGFEIVERPKRKNVRISDDPQTVAARQRREKVSEKIRVLQNLVPGGMKMDTASMLDEAANYLKFLRAQVKALENLRPKLDSTNFPFSSTFLPFPNPNQIHHSGYY